jgi:threonine dehydrogenase-like Zn-dependent dehydrogenase
MSPPVHTICPYQYRRVYSPPVNSVSVRFPATFCCRTDWHYYAGYFLLTLFV